MTDYKNPKLLLENAKIDEGAITWKSPSNIAIVKYWGKYGQQLPKNPSISFTLENAFTQTTMAYAPRQGQVVDNGVSLDFYFHDEKNEAFAAKVKKFLESQLEVFPFLNQLDLTIKSYNSFPHSAGIASSASAMSAIALCLCSLEDQFFGTLKDDAAFDRKASYISRLGSGSACRSIYGRMGSWGEMGEVEGSSNLYATPFENDIHDVFKTFHDDILIASAAEKSVSSRAGHGLMEGNPYAEARYAQARQRMHNLLGILRTGDVEAFGKIAEDEALGLHAMMMASNPSYLLMRPATITMIEKLRAFRESTGNPVYFSLDAGPNLHVLYPESAMHEVRPFIESELVPHCENEKWIADWVGEGPEQL